MERKKADVIEKQIVAYAEILRDAQERKYTGTITVKLAFYEGGVRGASLTTERDLCDRTKGEKG